MQFVMLYVEFFSIDEMSFTKHGAHTGHACSKIGPNSDLHSIEKITMLLRLTVRFNKPSTLFALFTLIST